MAVNLETLGVHFTSAFTHPWVGQGPRHTKRKNTQCLLLVEPQAVVGLQSFQGGVARLGVLGSLNSSQ